MDIARLQLLPFGFEKYARTLNYLSDVHLRAVLRTGRFRGDRDSKELRRAINDNSKRPGLSTILQETLVLVVFLTSTPSINLTLRAEEMKCVDGRNAAAGMTSTPEAACYDKVVQ